MIRRLFMLGLLMVLGAACASGGQTARRWATQDELKESRRMIETGHRRQAIDELAMMIELDPKNSEARFLRGIAYQGLEDFEKAFADYEELLRRNPRFSKAHYNIGMICAFKTNDPKRALAAFDRFLTLEPDHPKGVSVAKIMASLDGNRWASYDSYDLLAEREETALKIPDPVQRRMILSEWAKKDVDSALPLYLIGKAYQAEGKTDKAALSFRTALALSPTCGPCHQALGELLALSKKTVAEGRIHLKKAELFDPGRSGSSSPSPASP